MHSLPVYIDGEKCGSISKRADGLMTVLSARCSARPGRIVRLYVFGGGKSALLGTMQPDGDLHSFPTRRSSDLENKAPPIPYGAEVKWGALFRMSLSRYRRSLPGSALFRISCAA